MLTQREREEGLVSAEQLGQPATFITYDPRRLLILPGKKYINPKLTG